MTIDSAILNLDDWKLTLPADSSGGTSGNAAEVKELDGYSNSDFFYQSNDGAVVFNAKVDGATTSGSKYARSELREMDGSSLAAWTVAKGGTMTATLKVDEVPTKSDGSAGRIVVGQIHGQDNELIRLYYEDGKVYFMNDLAGSNNEETKFTFQNSSGTEPEISIGEVFSYKIEVRDSKLIVDIIADGQTYSSITEINNVWLSDTLYFKAGLYLGVNETSGAGSGQVSFYALDMSHEAGQGSGGIEAVPAAPVENKVVEITTVSEPITVKAEQPAITVQPQPIQAEALKTVIIRGDDDNNSISGNQLNNVIKGRGGADVIYGGDGADYIEGNLGDDVLIGGAGQDTLKGSSGYDVFKYESILEAGDFIMDFSSDDKLDLSILIDKLLPQFSGNSAELINSGYLDINNNGNFSEIFIDADAAGNSQKVLLCSLHIASDNSLDSSSIII